MDSILGYDYKSIVVLHSVPKYDPKIDFVNLVGLRIKN